MRAAYDASYLSAAFACVSAVSSEPALSADSVPGFGATVISISSSGVASMTRTSAFASLTALMASFAAAWASAAFAAASEILTEKTNFAVSFHCDGSRVSKLVAHERRQSRAEGLRLRQRNGFHICLHSNLNSDC